MFTSGQKQELEADLCRANVKTRKQGGRDLSYVESWHVIAEANRIFGFDGWTSETVDIKLVAERERTVGQGTGWGVTYIARVRIRVGEVTRDGCGSGHGIDRDLGQAHESALKEAESDARKRALMTFGNPFGLALYDKGQEHVSNEAQPKSSQTKLLQKETTAPKQDADHVTIAETLKMAIDKCETVRELDEYGGTIADKVAALPKQLADEVRHHFGQRKKALKLCENMAA